MKRCKIKLLLAEDHTIVRQALVDMFMKYDDICIVGEADNGQSLIKNYMALMPDIVLSDISMPEMNGTDAAIEILKIYPYAKIVFLSMYSSDEYIYRCYKLGAWGLIPKEVIKDDLVDAIRFVAEGQKYFMGKSHNELKGLISKIEQTKKISTESRSLKLTPREIEVLLIMAQGKTSEQIAEILGNVTKRAVDAHRSSMMKKLNFSKGAELIRFAVRYTYSIRDKSGM